MQLFGVTSATPPLTSAPTGVMLFTRRQPDKPATALNQFCSIRTSNGVYTELGIDPGQASSRYGLPVFSSSASPCRSLQPLRPGQPAARVGPATGSGRRPCVATTLCWLTGMENTSFPKPQKESTLRMLSFCGSGSYLSFHAVASTVFSAYKGLTSVFGMGTGGSP